ncbi:MAG: hypothetical protein BSOLF_2346 [Candidatus Carbobacillus altaicus]|uniref:DUF58 domain-containing protein n=1 Tax=Candidatus Carbonibacillus altaicus TaxID=2163959 RepID=A0A2R6XY66_9BACL|nr:MAG: hypothetical protein BSOLF_2346 [Candidatus Carbobacillus altaicus]
MNQLFSHVRGEVFGLLGTLFLILSLGYRNMLMFWIALLLFTWLPLSLRMTEKALQKITVEASFNRIGLFPEEEARLVFTIKNHARLTPLRLTVEFDLDEGLFLIVPASYQGRSSTRLGVTRYTFEVYLAGREQVVLHFSVVAKRRGAYRPFQAYVKADDQFGMVTMARVIELKGMLLVYPARKKIVENRPFVSGLGGLKKSPRLLIPDPFYIRGIRPYQAGDSLRALDMKRSAQMNRLMTRMFESTTDEHLFVAVNLQTHPNPFVKDEALFEDILRYVASWVLASDRQKVWQSVYMNVRQGRRAWTRFELSPGAGGTGGVRHVLSFLARLQHLRPTAFATVLKALEKEMKPTMRMLIISPWLDEEMRTVLYLLKRKGVKLFTLQLETGTIEAFRENAVLFEQIGALSAAQADGR